VIGRLDPGGVEMWLLALFAETRGRGVAHAVLALGSAPGSLEDIAAGLGVSVLRCPLRPLPGFPKRFSDLLRAASVEVVHSHVHHASGVLLWLAHRCGVPVRIAHSHTTEDGRPSTPTRRLYRRLGRYLIRRYATAGIAVASETATALFGSGWALDPRFRVIHNGIDLARFSEDVATEEVRRELGFPVGSPVVGQLARFHPVKNHEFSLRVAEALSRRDPRARFLFIGDGPLRGPAERQAEELGIREKCAFVGAVGVNVPRLLRGGVDLLLCPSLWEGLPVSLVEAQAAALPVLASASITREVAVVPGLVRFLDLGEGPDGWAAAAREALSVPRPSPRAAQARLARTDFDIRRSARRILELYAHQGAGNR
jgi:glycosyltransferase involved in cell wall biosynthesis